MSEFHGQPDPQPGPNTIRPGDPVPPDSVVGNSAFWPHGQQPAPQQPPKRKRRVGRTIALIVGGLFAVGIVAAVLSPGQPASDATKPATVASTSAAPPSVAVAPSTEPSEPSAVEPTTPPSQPPKVTHKPAPPLTASQEQAVGKAEDYLSFTAFSRSGLIEQLVFEGFSKRDATFAADHVTVNWNEQAAAKAKSYLEMTHFSRSGLVDQLEFDGFTHRQAVYGVTKAGL